MLRKCGHKGTKVSVWLTNEYFEKLQRLRAMTMLNTSDVLRALIAGKNTGDNARWAVINEIAKIGGIIRRQGESLDQARLKDLGERIVDLAKEIRREGHALYNQRQQDTGQ